MTINISELSDDDLSEILNGITVDIERRELLPTNILLDALQRIAKLVSNQVNTLLQ